MLFSTTTTFTQRQRKKERKKTLPPLNFTKGRGRGGGRKDNKHQGEATTMVFSSLPAYLDPSNWHQQQHQSHQETGSSGVNPHPHHLPLPPPPPPPPSQQQPQHGPVGGGGTIRPGSMAERARLSNIPMLETALKCPRCESTNTKFCYFNNYSLSQPRHFCKTCRRYWTRGGALRNVPVGGDCRRNKRSKSSSSKKSDQQTTTSASGGSVSNNSSSNNMMGSSTGSATGTTAEILGLTAQLPPLGFMAPLYHPHYHHQQGEFSSNKIGLSYGGLSAQPLGGITGDLGFQLGEGSSSGGGGNGNSLLSAVGAGGMEQWRTQQFPYISNLDMQAGLYPTYERGGESSLVLSKTLTSGVTSQLASVKMEDSNNNNNQELNLFRQMVGIEGNEQFWSTSGSAWTDLSGFSSSSTSNNNAI